GRCSWSRFDPTFPPRKSRQHMSVLESLIDDQAAAAAMQDPDTFSIAIQESPIGFYLETVAYAFSGRDPLAVTELFCKVANDPFSPLDRIPEEYIAQPALFHVASAEAEDPPDPPPQADADEGVTEDSAQEGDATSSEHNGTQLLALNPGNIPR